MGRKNINTLRDKLTPDRHARVTLKTNEMLGDMVLAEVRKLAGLTQAQLADSLGVKQPSVASMEAQEDMQISTLSRIVRALGGELEVVVKMPGGRVKLTQFTT